MTVIRFAIYRGSGKSCVMTFTQATNYLARIEPAVLAPASGPAGDPALPSWLH
jgi:hypothetical protein